MSNNNNEFVIKLLALLDEQKSKTQINTNIKDLEKVVRKLKLTATLAKGTTKTELNQVIKQLESQLRQVKLQARIDNRQLNREINNALRNVSARDINLNFNSNGERLNAQVRRAVAQAREFVERNPISVNIDLKREKLLNQLTAFTNKHTKINESSYWLGEAERLRTVISSVTNRDELRNATDQLQVFTSGVRATGYAAVSTTDRIKGMLGNVIKISNYFGLAFVAVNKFRQSLNTLKTNDTILTEISKTSEMTKQQLKELGNEAFKVASKYGQVSGNYLLAVQEMARSGYEMMSKELAELSLLAQSAGDMTADSANNYLLATDAAYKYSGSVEKLNAALDGANYISNKNSASLTDIADATRVSASFVANAGVAIDELTAAEATMIAVTKRSGSEIGRAFRSIVLNLQQVSGEFDGEEITEEQLKKVEARCHSLGVELEYMNNGVPTLRNTMEVLKELAEVYNSLPDNSAEKQGLISDLGGKYHANALSALLSRWDMYEKMLGEFSQGAGSALEEANKTADSWEGRLAQLQNSWDSFVNTLTNKTAVKGGVSFLDNTIQAFEKLTETVGALPVLLTTINASMSALNKNYGITQIYNKSTHKIDLQGNFMGLDITAYKTQANHFREASAAMETWNNRLIDGTANIDDFGISVVQNNEQLRAYLQTTSVDAPASLNGYRAYLNAAGQSTDALRLKTVLMTSVMSIGFSFALQAVFQLIQAGITVIDDWIHRVEKANEAMDEAITEYDSAKSSLESVNTELEEQNKKMDELLAKDKLTYAEKGQLEELQAITRELLLQQDIEQRRADKASKDVAEKTVDAYEKQYGKYDVSREHLNETLDYTNSTGISPIAESENDIIGNIAAYLNVTEGLKKAQQEYETALNNGEDTEFLIEDVQDYIDAIDDYSDVLDQNISDLQEKRLALEDEYNKAITKRENGQDLTSYETDAISTYESIYDAIKLIYEYTNKNDWNNMEISNIFNTEGIEKTKDELISMYKSGELSSAEMLEQFPKLNQAIKESEIMAGEGSNTFKEFFNEIAALADGTEDIVNNVASNSLPTLSDLLNAEYLSDTKKELLELAKSGELTPDTFTSTKEYMSLLEQTGLTAKQACDEIKKLPEFDMDLSDWQTQLQNARSNVSELRGMLDELTSKDSTGLSTSSVDKIISDYPKLLGYLNDTPRLIEEINSLISDQSDIANDAGSMIIEYSSDAYEQVKLSAQDAFEQVTTMQNGQIQSVAEMYGIDLNNYTNLAQAKKSIEFALLGSLNEGWAEHFGVVIDSLSGMAKVTQDLGGFYADSEAQSKLSAYNELITKLNSAKSRFESNINYGSVGVDKSKSGSSKKEEDKWLEEYKKKLAELQNLLDKGIINEREFFSQSEILLNTYLKDSGEHMTKYAEEISDAEKTLHSDIVNAYEYESEELARLRDGNYLDMVGYYQSMMGLQDEYYNSEALKLKNLADTMEAQYGRMSHVTLTRPSVDASEIQSAGYTTELTSSSVYAQSFGNEEKQVVVTPVLPDGTILSPDALASYADKLLNGEKIDADIQLAVFDGNDAVKQTAEYISGLEKMQSEYQTLKKTFSESPYGDFTEEQLKAIEELTKAVEEHKSQLVGGLSDIKSAYDDLIGIRDTYNEHGKISIDQYQSLCDMGFEYLALLSNESGALSLDEDAFQRLTDAKIQQIQVDMALQAVDLINNIQTEQQAVEYLAASYGSLANNALSAAEQMLYAAQANAQLMYGADSMQAQAANTIVKGYENSKLMAGVVDIKMQSGGGYEKPKEEKEEKQQEKTFDWIGTLLETISAKTGKIIDRIEKFYSWQKKNLMINRAVKATDTEITQNQLSYQSYMKAANAVRLRADYVKKIQEGKLNIETLRYTDGDVNSGIINKIEKYTEWYEKAQDCLETINSLYDQQRDLIRQKLDNVLDYYSDMDSQDKHVKGYG